MKTEYPVVRQSQSMLKDCSTPLPERAGVSAAEFLKQPQRHLHFPIQPVRVELMDGSHAEFKYAFAIVAEELKSIALFTEHCGHHVFPFHEAKDFHAGKLVYENSEA